MELCAYCCDNFRGTEKALGMSLFTVHVTPNTLPFSCVLPAVTAVNYLDSIHPPCISSLCLSHSFIQHASLFSFLHLYPLLNPLYTHLSTSFSLPFNSSPTYPPPPTPSLIPLALLLLLSAAEYQSTSLQVCSAGDCPSRDAVSCSTADFHCNQPKN